MMCMQEKGFWYLGVFGTLMGVAMIYIGWNYAPAPADIGLLFVGIIALLSGLIIVSIGMTTKKEMKSACMHRHSRKRSVADKQTGDALLSANNVKLNN